jgi:23S rRNA pseudouridine1911/1915/1917 synthase
MARLEFDDDSQRSGGRKHRSRIETLQANDAVLAVAKPAGLLTIPDRYDVSQPSLIEILTKRHGSLWIVHRLDRETSGVVVFARTEEAHRQLSESFAGGRVAKTYFALVDGRVNWVEEIVDLPLRPDADRRHRTHVDRARGKPSETAFRLLEHVGPFSLVEATPRTGRTHQIRVHLAQIGHPVVCDGLYGRSEPIMLSRFKHKYVEGRRPERPLLSRLGLHAVSVELVVPGHGSTLIEAPLPRDLKATVRQLRKHAR